jgi:hypothetical protein
MPDFSFEWVRITGTIFLATDLHGFIEYLFACNLLMKIHGSDLY